MTKILGSNDSELVLKSGWVLPSARWRVWLSLWAFVFAWVLESLSGSESLWPLVLGWVSESVSALVWPSQWASGWMSVR